MDTVHLHDNVHTFLCAPRAEFCKYLPRRRIFPTNVLENSEALNSYPLQLSIPQDLTVFRNTGN